jgi:hypothetical protein
MEDFAMVERPQVCRRCNFRRLCYPRAEDRAAMPALAAAPADQPSPAPA